MGITRKARSLFRILHREYSWYRDTWICRSGITQKALREIPAGKKIILMPHSDDEWIGCSQILLRQSEQVLVVNMDMAGGDSEELHRTRRNEAQSAAEKYGYRFLTVQERIKDLAGILLAEQPVCVFLPCYLDWHEEHIEVMRIFQQAAVESGYSQMVGMYQVSLPIPEKLINSGMTMTRKQLNEKWNCLGKLYKTQAFLPVKRFKLNEYINGGVSGSYALEAYCILKYHEWEHALRHNGMSDDYREKVLKHLQEIRTVRELLVR